MKKYFYRYEDGYEDAVPGMERYIITVPSSYEPEDMGVGATADTGGNPLGEYEIAEEEELLAFISENLRFFEEMEPEEEQERVENLALAWGLEAQELEHLR